MHGHDPSSFSKPSQQSARPFLYACAFDEFDCSDREHGCRPADDGDGVKHGAGAGGYHH
jgi:hypothetical protein